VNTVDGLIALELYLDESELYNQVRIGIELIGLCEQSPRQMNEEEASTWIDWHTTWAAMTQDERDRHLGLIALENL